MSAAGLFGGVVMATSPAPSSLRVSDSEDGTWRFEAYERLAEEAITAAPRASWQTASPRANRSPKLHVDMCSTCFYVVHMSTMVQIRNVPDTLHRRLKSRAALAGMSLSDYLLSEIREVAARPTLEELRARLERRSAVNPSVPPAQAVRAERDR